MNVVFRSEANFFTSSRTLILSIGFIPEEGKPGDIRENQEVRDIYLGEEI
jgi:ABC-type lipopolysaccharide export system ATPase subunit